MNTATVILATKYRSTFNNLERLLDETILSALDLVTIDGFEQLYKLLQGTFFTHMGYGISCLKLELIRYENTTWKIEFCQPQMGGNFIMQIPELSLEDKLTLLEAIERVL